MNKQFKVGERVYCVLNHAIKGEIRVASNYHGLWQYHLKVDDKKSFLRYMRASDNNVVFLHWQLRKDS